MAVVAAASLLTVQFKTVSPPGIGSGLRGMVGVDGRVAFLIGTQRNHECQGFLTCAHDEASPFLGQNRGQPYER